MYENLPKYWESIVGDIHKPLEYTKSLYNNSNEFDICPRRSDLFKVFHLVKPENVRVVILGQDPYFSLDKVGIPVADGIAFSVGNNPPQPTLVNIIKELREEGELKLSETYDLSQWVKQGVLLLNICLIARTGQANLYSNIGWSILTRNVIHYLTSDDRPLVFMFWGNFAKVARAYVVSGSRNKLFLFATHPSPRSASSGFFKCGHFIKCNEFLKQNGLKSIDWNLYNV